LHARCGCAWADDARARGVAIGGYEKLLRTRNRLQCTCAACGLAVRICLRSALAGAADIIAISRTASQSPQRFPGWNAPFYTPGWWCARSVPFLAGIDCDVRHRPLGLHARERRGYTHAVSVPPDRRDQGGTRLCSKMFGARPLAKGHGNFERLKSPCARSPSSKPLPIGVIWGSDCAAISGGAKDTGALTLLSDGPGKSIAQPANFSFEPGRSCSNSRSERESQRLTIEYCICTTRTI